jgi:cell fate regulator YaaT (PSP1 superfamily)
MMEEQVLTEQKKIEIVGVRFDKAGKVYYFNPMGITLEKGDAAIVETERGTDFGRVAFGNRFISENTISSQLKPVVRKATDADFDQEAANKIREKEAAPIFIEKVKKHGLQMKLVAVDLLFDQSRINFYYTADGRVDFRELVKDLGSAFRMRADLWQIMVRDEAKRKNGIGICGRTLCCSTFLESFQPVSIKMAKDQNLSLNPTKISGICGRLMCCLKYEEETYEYLNRTLPGEGDLIKTPDGTGEVQSVSILRQLVKAAVRKKPSDTPAINVYNVSEITVLKAKQRNDSGGDDTIETLLN